MGLFSTIRRIELEMVNLRFNTTGTLTTLSQYIDYRKMYRILYNIVFVKGVLI